jgi:hypothetical protein
VSKYTREGKRKDSNSEYATHHQNGKYGFTQKALSSFDRRLDNLFASPLHISLQSLCFAETYFGTIDGSPPGVPGGGMTGVLPPPTGGAAIPGSTPAGGQMIPFDCDSWSLSEAPPVVSPGVGTTPR